MAAPQQNPTTIPPVGARRTGTWLVLIFCSPFVVAGLFVGWDALRTLLGEDPGSDAVMQMAAAFCFVAMGSFGLGVGLREVRADRVRSLLRTLHPAEPWRWHPDWGSGRVACEGRSAALGFGFFALLWNAFCVPMFFVVSPGERLFVGIFVLVGIGVTAAAGLATWRWLRFGRSVLELSTLPGRPGGRLRATVHLRGRMEAKKGFHATLSCLRLSGARNRTQHLVWQEEGHVSRDRATVGPLGSAVPVDFPLPADAAPSRLPGEANGTVWRLALAADLPGVDFVTSFEVPVYGSAPADAEVPLELGPILEPEAPMELDRERFTARSPNRMRLRPDGAVELRFPAARNKGQAAFVSAVTLVWSFFAALAWFAAPLFFGVVFVAAWIFLVFGSLCLWFRRFRVVADRTGLVLRWRLLGVGWTRRIELEAIEKIEPGIQGEFGRRPMYDLKIHRKARRPVTAADGVRSKREAEWLCAAMWLGLRGGRQD